MKTILISILLGLASISFAGPRVNNGGGSWICRNSDGSVRWMQTHDLFFLYRQDPSGGFRKKGDAWAIYNERLNFIKTHLPDLNALLDRHPLDLRKTIKMYDVEIDLIGDAEVYYRPLRESCREGRVGYEQIADFLPGNQLVINKSLWNDKAFSETDKAAILLHERIYFALRTESDDQTSWATQTIVSALFSPQNLSDIQNDVYETLTRSASPERKAGSVVLFPVELKCNASISKLTSSGGSTVVETVSSDYWSSNTEADVYSQTVMNFHFTMEPNPEDGSPQLVKIEDTTTGTSSELLDSVTKATFVMNKLVSVSLRNTQTGLQATLDCWTP